jgi:hypothetical protein
MPGLAVEFHPRELLMSLGVVVGGQQGLLDAGDHRLQAQALVDHHGLERGHVDVHQPASFGNSTCTTAFATSA